MKIKTASKVLDEQIDTDEELRDLVARERLNFECAAMIYKIRKDEGLSQKALAEIVGTSQSAIARLESADYAGRTIHMLQRIASSLGYEVKLEVIRTKGQPEPTIPKRRRSA